MPKKLKTGVILAISLLIVFKAWFGSGVISAGDAGFYFGETSKDFYFSPYIWLSSNLGQYQGLLYPFIYLVLPIKVLAYLNFPWSLIERLIWYWPFLGLSLFSSWFLIKTLGSKIKPLRPCKDGASVDGLASFLSHPSSPMEGRGILKCEIKFAFLSPLVYLFNSYILMIIGGGQISIALAYALFPLTFALLVRSLDSRSFRKQVIAGLVLSLQAAFEPRMAALVGLVALFYAFWEFRLAIAKFFQAFLLPFLITVGLHFYWLLPLIIFKKGTYLQSLSSADWVEFMSFADFSNSFSLLHPNWPENIFGKTYFMRPEFLLVPIIAFASLLFIKETKSKSLRKNILFFTFIALVGSFLAKGSKPPFGEIYLWFFNHFPGANLFRDPTKFYVLTAFAYSFLIPFSVSKIYLRLKAKSSPKQAMGFVLLVFLYLLFLIRPAILGELNGTFKTKEVPQEYLTLKNYLNRQDEYFRTLWIPKVSRFGFSSRNHPTVKNNELFSQEDLRMTGIKYVIIPYDSEEEIFLKDRQYDHYQRQVLEEELNGVSWLKKIEVADKIAVYETPSYEDHFFVVDDKLASVRWEMINPTKYKVQVKNSPQTLDLVFSETFDELWQAKVKNKIFTSTEFSGLNYFKIDQAGDFEVLVEFAAQKYVYWGGIVSFTILLLVFGYLVSDFRQRKA